MNIIEIILISISLGMDAFTVSVIKGCSIDNKALNKSLMIGACFGLFQFFMPLFGYLSIKILNLKYFEYSFLISTIIFIVLGLINIFSNKEKIDNDFFIKTLLIEGIATSLDAYSVGVSFAFIDINLIVAVLFIGIITFLMCFIGTYIGYNFKFNNYNISKKIGGGLLIFLGLKILISNI